MRKLLIFILFLGLSGCSVYRMDIQQGNVIEAEKLAQLKPGMDAEQVRFLMGSPLLQDPFHPGRWDYVYYLDEAGKPPVERHLTLYFEQGRLARIEEGPNLEVTRTEE